MSRPNRTRLLQVAVVPCFIVGLLATSASGARAGLGVQRPLLRAVPSVATTTTEIVSPTPTPTPQTSLPQVSVPPVSAATPAVATPAVAAPAAAAPAAAKTSSYANAEVRIGLSYGDTLFGASPSLLAQTLNDAVAVGAGWIRVDLAWDDIQPTSSATFNWTPFDAIVQAASARNLQVLALLSYTPAWARPSDCTTSDKCSPAVPAQFATFAAAAVTRYAPLGLHTWEVWNEPNITNFWQPAPNAAAYVALLQPTAAAIHAADPTATVISGGLAPAPTANGDISQLDFLSEFCAAGGPSLVNAIGYHPYSYPVPPGYYVGWNAWSQIAATPESFQSVLAGCGAGTKQVWLTEYGAPTNGPGVGATTSNYEIGNSPDHVSQPLQAEMASDSVTLAGSSTFIGALFWYSYTDLGTDATNTEDWYGLRNFNGTQKPAWSSFQHAIRTIRG